MASDINQHGRSPAYMIRNMKTGDRAGRGFALRITDGDDNCRAMIFFHQFGGHQTDYSLIVGFVRGNKQFGKMYRIRIFQCMGNGGPGHFLAGTIYTPKGGCQIRGLFWVAGTQQTQAFQRVFQAAGGIQAGTNYKTDMISVYRSSLVVDRKQASFFKQGEETGTGGGIKL